MVRGGVSDFAAVAARVLDGRALLWIAWDGKRITAAAVTELAAVNGRKLCMIVACAKGRPHPSSRAAGADRRRWMRALDTIEAFAKAEGCAAMLVMGRRGWKRALPQYRERGIILEKELS